MALIHPSQIVRSAKEAMEDFHKAEKSMKNTTEKKKNRATENLQWIGSLKLV